MATGTPAQNSGNSAAAQARAQNIAARQLIVANAVDLVQPIASGAIAFTAGQQSVVNVPVRNVGLIKRFWIEFNLTIGKSTATSMQKTTMGLANLLSSVVLTDLNNQTRVSTAGWHLHYLASVRRQLAFGAAFASSDPTGIGNNWGLMTTPSPITFAGGAQTARWFVEIPVSYSDTDLSGAIWANVLNATMNLQFTVNPNLIAAAGTDPVLSAYQSSDANLGTLTGTYTVYQNSLDQLPINPKTGTVILPPVDLEYVYLINNTSVSALVVNQDNAIPYANWRNFLSTFVIYDNAGALNLGTDVSAIKLQSANFTNIFNLDPFMLSLLTRTKINDDFAPGVYYIDSRAKPINTLQYGNMQLLVNPSAVTAGATLLVGYESLALQGVMNQAGSIFQS